MPIKTALSAWQSLMDLADNEPKIHITGGEPFLYYDHMAELLTEANKLDLTGFDLLETNGFWATDKHLIAERLNFLDSMGMKRFKVSWDPFHAEFIDPEPVKLLAQTAVDILGSDRVLVRWEKYLQEPVSKIRDVSEKYRLEQYSSAMQEYPVMFTGRASEKLAKLSNPKPIESFISENCKSDFLGAKGVHIDPYGNVFSAQCSGIIIGNVDHTPLEEIWRQFDPQTTETIEILFNSGPSGLLPAALNAGYKQTLYSDKCHLCSELRQFFFDNGMYNSIIGPCDCYRSNQQAIKEKVLVKE
jgi:MoaA/NifB/PqqE/SkfB family radical SAM enzyme